MTRLAICRYTGPVCIEDGLHPCLARSDTLSAAIISTLVHLVTAQELAEVAANPPFRVSSALPTLQDQSDADWRVLYPLPLAWRQELVRRYPLARKEIKRLRFVDDTTLRQIGSERILPPSALRSGDGYLGYQFSRRLGDSAFASVERRTRVSVDRLTSGPLPGLLFQSSSWRLAADAGFAVLYQADESFRPRFSSALQLLGHQGLGADRTTGCGGFEVVDDRAWSPPMEAGSNHLLLSVYWPRPSEVRSGALGGIYEMTSRDGWVSPGFGLSLRRGGLRCLVEGSLIPASDALSKCGSLGAIATVLGADPQLGLEHPVYRDGRAMTMGVP